VSGVPFIPLSVTAEVASLVRLGVVAAAPVRVGPSRPSLLEERDLVVTRAVELQAPGPDSIARLRPARELYRAFGIDPTKTRPSSEALLRRVLKGQPLPRINSAVDLCNLLSLRFLLPIGLYDAGAIDGPVQLRKGLPGESYEGIRKSEVHLGGRPALSDRRGAFGNPSSDSARTSVSESTTRLWMVVFAPRGLPVVTLEEDVRIARETIERHLGDGSRPVETSGAVV